MNIIFPTFEIAPINNGGVSQYILSVIQELQKVKNEHYNALILLYNKPQEDAVKAREYFNKLNFKCEIIYINEFTNIHLTSEDVWNIEKVASALKDALENLINQKPVAGIEWCDYGGAGFHCFRDKHTNPKSIFKNIPMWVHLHGVREIWDLTERYPVSLDQGNGYVISNYAERLSLELADAWKSPSQALANWYSSYFGILNKVFISPLPYRKLAELNSHRKFINHQLPLQILCPGRVQYIKGNDIVVRAGVELCKIFPDQFHITFAGYDTPTANKEYKSFVEEVKSFIPPKFTSHFSFSGKFSAEQYLQIAQKSNLAIFASRVETFCLAAHELNWLSMPLILSDIPAFEDYFVDGDNCYKFDGSVAGLVVVLEKILTNLELLTNIANQPSPDFVPYVFAELTSLPPNIKLNANYTLFTRILELTSNKNNSDDINVTQTLQEIASLQTRITAMETSKFWQLRKLWFKIKRKLGLTQETP